MKKILLSLIAIVAISQSTYAQWTTTGNNISNTNTGNVGIGTTTPIENLQVVTNVSSVIGVSGSAGNVRDFRFETGGVPRWILRSDATAESGSNSGSDFSIIGRDDTGALLGTYLFIKRSNGNIGIGTINPYNYKLAVNGSAIATSMTVKLFANWPDYVFKTNYKLPALHEVKTYIDANHHLPGVPTEQEVKQNGLNLGEMNKILLQKVEELTLYMVEKDKQLNDEKEINYKQQQEIDKLKQQMQQLMIDVNKSKANN